MNLNPSAVYLCVLSLACAGRAKELRQSALLASPCRHAATSQSNAVIRVKVEPKRAENEYLQLTVFGVRSGQPDSVIAHAVRNFDALPPLPPGLYRLRARSLGYQTAMDTVRVRPGESWCVRVRLANAVALAPAPAP